MSIPPKEKETSEKWLFSCDPMLLLSVKGTEDKAGDVIWHAFTDSPPAGYTKTGISQHYTSNQPKHQER